MKPGSELFLHVRDTDALPDTHVGVAVNDIDISRQETWDETTVCQRCGDGLRRRGMNSSRWAFR